MTTVLCHGVFDVLHPGHIEHLKQARALGDTLIIAIVADAFVRKGEGRPMFNQFQRREALKALRFVSEVDIVESPLAMPILEVLKPNVFCKGPDYANPSNRFADDFQREKAFVESYGGKVVLTTGFTSSSTAVIAAMKKRRPEIEAIRSKYGLHGVLAWLDKAKQVDALVIGEEILDEYIYVTPLFKSAKENIVTHKPVGNASWRGGAEIVRQDLAEFARSASLLLDGPPITKRRYVDDAFKQKLFAVTEDAQVKPLTQEWNLLPLTVVADYGHGLITQAGAAKIAAKDTFLAMTVQSNSSNWGFNLITKWPRADYVCIDQNELRLACGDQHTDIETLARRQQERMYADYFCVTLGHEGAFVLGIDTYARMPALADKVVDRMGAGDAFLAATAPLAWAGTSPDIIALVGNIAGAIKVSKVGNQAITRKEVETWLTNLLA